MNEPNIEGDVKFNILRHRLDWRRIQVRLQRERDERGGTIWRQLWSMIRGRDV